MGTPARSSSSVRADIARGIPYRVVIIEDSAVIRGMMSRWLSESGEFEVVARYGNGTSALNRISDVQAEVVILDVDAANLNGVALLPKLLEKDSTFKVLAVTTSETDKAKGESALMAAGAAEVVVRPATTRDVTTSKDFRSDFVQTTRCLGVAYRNDNNEPRSRLRRTPEVSIKVTPGVKDEGKIGDPDSTGSKNYTLVSPSKVKPRILAIGSSTGGPKALYEVLTSMKCKLDVPVVITQHMPPLFTGILAEHLQKASGMVAKEGEHGERVVAGQIYVAPGDHHMVLTGTEVDLKIELNQGPEENFCRPSVDPLFRSVAKIFGASSLCLVLTGMGQDGCNGARDIVTAGGTVLAQDEPTSVVWGMPGAVAKAGQCAEILPLTEIGPRAVSFLKGAVK